MDCFLNRRAMSESSKKMPKLIDILEEAHTTQSETLKALRCMVK